MSSEKTGDCAAASARCAASRSRVDTKCPMLGVGRRFREGVPAAHGVAEEQDRLGSRQGTQRPADRGEALLHRGRRALVLVREVRRRSRSPAGSRRAPISSLRGAAWIALRSDGAVGGEVLREPEPRAEDEERDLVVGPQRVEESSAPAASCASALRPSGPRCGTGRPSRTGGPVGSAGVSAGDAAPRAPTSSLVVRAAGDGVGDRADPLHRLDRHGLAVDEELEVLLLQIRDHAALLVGDVERDLDLGDRDVLVDRLLGRPGRPRRRAPSASPPAARSFRGFTRAPPAAASGDRAAARVARGPAGRARRGEFGSGRPLASHSFGYMEIAVNPGSVFTSFTRSRPVPFSKKKSTRAIPERRQARNTRIESSRASSRTSALTSAGMTSFALSSRYLSS